ncbi:Uncharacterised protein [Vibrio cholerae]|uniref:Uncharacterized protein n=2 Tax=Vibrio cholerae TaxID=666 RepID=A0A655WWD8_VIBCL|nr:MULTISPECIES: hypothetical protein [Vibrio]EGQ7701516.1 hypothetical protein [Vibrio cholerae]EGR0612395.1 hypothetical protein [Vibrio cholerae]EGR3865304.1 hypothetical protein [Vibrio cholerae]EIK2268967.1 hypothetical protein [Vibrio cholerae]EJK2098708.1 hypothetical protein [Vibrio cholerae]
MNSIRFHRRPMPVIADHRPMYKISLLLLILKECSIGGTSSLIRLHLFNWALKDKKRMNQLMLSADNKELTFDIWGMDPTVNFAISHSIANGLMVKIPSGYKITQKGEDFLSEYNIKKEFSSIDFFINSVKKKVTQKMVDNVALRWKNEV